MNRMAPLSQDTREDPQSLTNSGDDDSLGGMSPDDLIASSPTPPSFKRVQVLAKVRDILDLFTQAQPVLDLQTIRKLSGLPASTCVRLVQNMVADGLLDQSGTNFRIGLAVVRWAAVARQGLGLIEVASPELRKLRDLVGETTGLFVRDGDQRVCVGLAEGIHVVGRRLSLGHVAPLHANAAGKAILAFDPEARQALRGSKLERFTERTKTSIADLEDELATAREHGFAVSRGEWHQDVGGAAAPIFGADGGVIASIGVSVPINRLNDETLATVGAALVQSAARVSAGLGFAR